MTRSRTPSFAVAGALALVVATAQPLRADAEGAAAAPVAAETAAAEAAVAGLDEIDAMIAAVDALIEMQDVRLDELVDLAEAETDAQRRRGLEANITALTRSLDELERERAKAASLAATLRAQGEPKQ